MRRQRTTGPVPRTASGHGSRLRGPRAGRGALTGGLAVALAVSAVVLAPAASAALPHFPDNIVVYPDRDMVSLEGFAAAAGQDATVQVRRDSTVIGAATVAGAPAPATATGSPSVVVNHPGGVCWGAGGG